MTLRDGVSVVVPVYNNADSLPELCKRLHRTLVAVPHEIILVDDSSIDRIQEILTRLDARVLVHECNLGQSAAILTGIRAAQFDVVSVLDADLEDPPEHVLLLVDHLRQSKASVVFSRRKTQFKLSSFLFRLAMQGMYPQLPFWSCLHFAADAEATGKILHLAEPDDYLVAVIGALKISCQSLNLQRGQRIHGQSAYPGWRRAAHAMRLTRAAFRRRLKGSRISSDESVRDG